MELNRGRGGLFGMSARPGWRPLAGTVTEGVIPGSSINGFGYFGGPVVACPQIYVGFWGLQYYRDPSYQALANQLTRFMTDLPSSTFMNVLSQYGAGGGAGLAGAFVQAHVLGIEGTEFTNQDITNWIQLLIDFGVMPDASPRPSQGVSNQGTVVMVIFLDETIEVNDPGFAGGIDGGLVLCEPSGGTAFGYHYFFNTKSGNAIYYAVIPALTDTCVTETCQGASNCTLQLSQTQLQRITQASSHEFAEMCTDPQPPLTGVPELGSTGWYPEIGDPCAGQSATLTYRSDTWDVQNIYSLWDDLQSQGSYACMGPQQYPLPVSTDGPGFAEMPFLSRFRPGHLDRLLPLPPVYVDGTNRSFEIREQDLSQYVARLTAPLRSADVPGHLPRLLRQAADYLER